MIISLLDVVSERQTKGANKALDMLSGNRPSNYYELKKEAEFVAKLSHLNTVKKFIKEHA